MNPKIEFPITTTRLRELKYGLEKVVREKLAALTSAQKPFIVHMLGIPGAGKTTFANQIYNELQQLLNGDTLYLGFDRIMTEIPEYSSVDKVTAFAKYEIPAREAGYVLLKSALERRANIFFDHGGAAADHPAILRYASEALGYRTFMVYIKCDTAVAKSRVERRALAEGRHTPLSYIDERYKIIEDLLPQYVADLTAMFMVDNSAAVLNRAEIASSLGHCIATIQRSSGAELSPQRGHA